MISPCEPGVLTLLIHLTPRNRSFFVMLIVADLIKNCLFFTETENLFRVHIPQLIYSVSANLMHLPPLKIYSRKIHFNFILLSMFRSPCGLFH
jgi:hypothetical protein